MKTTPSRMDARTSASAPSGSTATDGREGGGVHTTGMPTGGLVSLDGETYYRIAAYDTMPPFMMTLASDSDLWMFVTSGGGLTAGRVDVSGRLFFYETVDRLHDAHHHSGPITLIRTMNDDGVDVLWQPFPPDGEHSEGDERSLYKSVTGTRLIFESVNRELGLAFRYRWAASDEYGWVRTSMLRNLTGRRIDVEVLDGLRNVLPYGVPESVCRHASNLADAYRKSEVDSETGMGIYSLTAGITDRVEAVEVLRANIAWCAGLDDFGVHLAGSAIHAFRRDEEPDETAVVNGQRGNYAVTTRLALEPEGERRWHLIADAARGHVEIAAVRKRMLESASLSQQVEAALDDEERRVLANIASADGIQMTADAVVSAHHQANVLFNNMRGGVPHRNYDIPTEDLAAFIAKRNSSVAERYHTVLDGLPAVTTVTELTEAARATGDADLERLCHEYLPVYFGRRHGDPSRPWNQFSVRVRNGDGSRALHYEGNWRDIFQNWEALTASFPLFLPSIIAKFANASTVDGYNPYRISRDGVDWETPDPDDPWRHIGYWGDHQIIYLLKLLEAMRDYLPGELEALLPREVLSYADVPYRIKPFADILKDPDSTIVYDTDHDRRIQQRVEALGSDGRLVVDTDGEIYHASLLEKLLVPLLAKLSNLVPDGGIWMNTQRPEWNDANNALVGDGVSVVTLYYLRRYVSFLEDLLGGALDRSAPVAGEVIDWFRRVHETIEATAPMLETDLMSDRARKQLLDDLGESFSAYRSEVYAHGLTNKRPLAVAEVLELCRTARRLLEHGIRANRRADGLYNAYSLLSFTGGGHEASLQPLHEMLEGQVGALSSGLLDGEESVEVLRRLFESALYREDQASFLLYPERVLPGFLEKNVVPREAVEAVPLLAGLLGSGDDSIVAVDAFGVCRFHASLRHEQDLEEALDRLGEASPDLGNRVDGERAAVLELFEQVFHHRCYTGRSGAMYAYEGLGCIYWHMVAKLLLAVQEVTLRASTDGTARETVDDLVALYYAIRSGLGFEKSPAEYGAFPTDPYSHTPPHGGAKQPGMTGQVKEEILTRFGELGVSVEGGRIRFRPILLRPAEFLTAPGDFRFYDVSGEERTLELRADTLAFTFCQVPVVYERANGDGSWVRVILSDGGTRGYRGDSLDEEISRSVFDRSGRVVRIHVGVPEHTLCSLSRSSF